MRHVRVEPQDGVTSYALSRRVAILEIKGVRKAVLRVLADHYPNIWPSIGTIAFEAGFGTTAVRKALRELELDGYISPIGDRRGGCRGSEQYRIHVEAITMGPSRSGTQREPLPSSNPTPGEPNPTPRAKSPTPRVAEQRNKQSRTEKENHHASGALRDWFSIKAELQNKLPEDQFNQWVRPMYLLKVMGRQLLLALPPNGAMMEAANANRDILQQTARKLGYDGCSLTPYPTVYERERLAKEYPAFYAGMYGNGSSKGARATTRGLDLRGVPMRSTGGTFAEAS